MQRLDSFINELYSKPPEVPYHYDINCDNLEDTIFEILVKGSEKLFKIKEAHVLTDKQIRVLHEYLQSIGYDFRVKRSFLNIFGNQKYELEFFPFIVNDVCHKDIYVWITK